MNEVFEKYIPKFEYELINLNQYSIEDLMLFGDTLSYLMIIDTIKKPEDIQVLKKLTPEYRKKLIECIPDHLLKIVADVITVLLTKIDVPEDEIETITENIENRRLQEMFAIENYSVQETRREAKAEGKAEGKIESTVNMVNELQIPVKQAMRIAQLTGEYEEQVIAELKKQNILYTL
jgi:hypothetical protein